MQSYISTTKKNAVQRIIGTCIGAFFGLIVLLIINFCRNDFVIYPDHKANEIYSILEQEGFTEILKILKYKSNDYAGCSYIKIFNK